MNKEYSDESVERMKKQMAILNKSTSQDKKAIKASKARRVKAKRAEERRAEYIKSRKEKK